MKLDPFQFKTSVVCLWLMGLLASCISPTKPAHHAGQNSLGTLRITGDHVQVNKRPTIDGETIQHDDNVTTGAKSSAFIHCYTCSIIQLEENTD